MTDLIDIAIIGGGAAGLAAGLYSAQGGMKTVISGHNTRRKAGKHNTSYKLSGLLKRHRWLYISYGDGEGKRKAGAVILNEKVTSLVLEGETKQIITNSNKYYAKSIIISRCCAKARRLRQ